MNYTNWVEVTRRLQALKLALCAIRKTDVPLIIYSIGTEAYIVHPLGFITVPILITKYHRCTNGGSRFVPFIFQHISIAVGVIRTVA